MIFFKFLLYLKNPVLANKRELNIYVSFTHFSNFCLLINNLSANQNYFIFFT
jgi:hypothetical protein